MPELERIRSGANSVGLSKQIFLSDWYAHYKFFWQMQVDWIHESRPFSFFRDKIPLSAYAAVALIVGLAFLWHADFIGNGVMSSSPAASAPPSGAVKP